LAHPFAIGYRWNHLNGVNGAIKCRGQNGHSKVMTDKGTIGDNVDPLVSMEICW
jgi:hypothetical protein